MSPTLRAPLLLALLLAFAGCDPGEEPDDASPERDASEETCTPLGEFERGADEGHAAPLETPAGEARAGRLDAAELPEDRLGLARWRAGDFALANDSVALLISASGPGEAYDPYVGRPVGVARVANGELVDAADFGLVLLGLQRFAVGTEHVGVLRDGADGGPAVVRVTGPLVAIEAFDDLLDALLPADFTGLPAAIDFSLAPDAEHVEVTLSVRAGTRSLRAQLGALQVFFQNFRMPAWRPGAGFDLSETSSAPYVAFEDPDRTSYAWMSSDSDEELVPLVSMGGADVFRSSRLSVPACEEGNLSLGRMMIAGPGLPGVQSAIRRLDDQASRAVEGRVTEAGGAPVGGARVHLVSATEGHLSRALTDDEGRFALEGPAGEGELFVFRQGQPLAGPFAIAEGSTEITLPETGTVRVEARDIGTLAALPARIEVFPTEGAPPTLPATFGERTFGGGRLWVDFPTDGVSEIPLLPGTYRLRVSRGPAYERAESDVVVTAGETVSFIAELERVIELPGVLCADYHIHTHRSVDSADPGALKVAGLVADGLEIAIRSEHEFVADFQPVIDELGLGAFARGFGGLELTTFSYGHFGVFPLTPDSSLPSDGAIPWTGRLAPEFFEEARARVESPTLIINHPRSTGLRQAYFSEVGLDPETGTVSRPELWDESFRVVEVFNDSDFERNRDGTVRDWLALLSVGRRIAAVGSSDSHRIYGTPVGYPRTCLQVGTDDPRALDVSVLQRATEEGHSVVSGGIYLDVRGPGGTGPGDTAMSVGARATIEVDVLAASYVEVNRLEVIVDGERTELIPLDPADAVGVLRARAELEVDVSETGSYVIIHAAGDTAFDAAGKLPFAVSNPLYLER